MLGLCDDDLPLLLDMGEADPGGLLLTGDSALGIGLLLKSILVSGCLLNPPELLNLSLISSRPDFFGALEREPHLRINFHTGSREAALLIEEFASLVDERHASGASAPIQVLAVDGLCELLSALDEHQQRLMEWAPAAGPAVGAWVIAADAGGADESLTDELLASLPTRLFTRIGRGENKWTAGIGIEGRPSRLAPGREALLCAAGETIQLQVVMAERGDYDLLASEATDWNPRDETLSRLPKSFRGEG
jgi:hypothetical protein